jgi:hypothetical protein
MMTLRCQGVTHWFRSMTSCGVKCSLHEAEVELFTEFGLALIRSPLLVAVFSMWRRLLAAGSPLLRACQAGEAAGSPAMGNTFAAASPAALAQAAWPSLLQHSTALTHGWQAGLKASSAGGCTTRCFATHFERKAAANPGALSCTRRGGGQTGGGTRLGLVHKWPACGIV